MRISNQTYIENWLYHFIGAPDSDNFLDVKLLGDVANLLQMRIVRTAVCVSLVQERQVSHLAIDYGVADCKPMLTPTILHINLKKSLYPPQAVILFMQPVRLCLDCSARAYMEVM